MEELDSIVVKGQAPRYLDNAERMQPISLSEGVLTTDPISITSFPLVFSLSAGLNDTVSRAVIDMHPMSLPVTFMLVSSFGVHSSAVSALPGQQATLTAATVLAGTFALHMTSIDALRSTWTFQDRVVFKVHFFGSTAKSTQHIAHTVFDRFGRSVFTRVRNNGTVSVANIYIDSSPLSVTTYSLWGQEAPPHGAIRLSGETFAGNSTVVAERVVSANAPVTETYIAEASALDRNATTESCLRLLGELSDSISAALEGTGLIASDVHQPSFVLSNYGYVRALAAAATVTAEPRVQVDQIALEADIFPKIDGYSYTAEPSNTVAVQQIDTIDLLPPINAFDLQAVLALQNYAAPPTTSVIAATVTEYSLSSSTPGFLITDSGTIFSKQATNISVPLGAANAQLQTQTLAPLANTLVYFGCRGVIPVEVLTGEHQSVIFERGRLGVIQPPVVGTVAALGDTHHVLVHAFHSDQTPAGNLELRWAHQPSTEKTTLVFPLQNSHVLARDTTSTVLARRLGVPLQAHIARTITFSTAVPTSNVTIAMWVFVDANERLDTWRTPLEGGAIFSTTGWLNVSIDRNSTLRVHSHTSNASVYFAAPRDRWIFVCARPAERSVTVVHASGSFKQTLDFPILSSPTVASIDGSMTGIHPKNITIWNTNLSSAVVRTLAHSLVGPFMSYDFAWAELNWLPSTPMNVGAETALVATGPPAAAFEISNSGRVWYISASQPPHLVNLAYNGGLTRATFSSSVVLGYAAGQGLRVISVDRNIVILSGTVLQIPPGSFFSASGIPVTS